jgi:hypothetical protein
MHLRGVATLCYALCDSDSFGLCSGRAYDNKITLRPWLRRSRRRLVWCGTRRDLRPNPGKKLCLLAQCNKQQDQPYRDRRGASNGIVSTQAEVLNLHPSHNTQQKKNTSDECKSSFKIHPAALPFQPGLPAVDLSMSMSYHSFPVSPHQITVDLPRVYWASRTYLVIVRRSRSCVNGKGMRIGMRHGVLMAVQPGRRQLALVQKERGKLSDEHGLQLDG